MGVQFSSRVLTLHAAIYSSLVCVWILSTNCRWGILVSSSALFFKWRILQSETQVKEDSLHVTNNIPISLLFKVTAILYLIRYPIFITYNFILKPHNTNQSIQKAFWKLFFSFENRLSLRFFHSKVELQDLFNVFTTLLCWELSSLPGARLTVFSSPLPVTDSCHSQWESYNPHLNRQQQLASSLTVVLILTHSYTYIHTHAHTRTHSLTWTQRYLFIVANWEQPNTQLQEND